MPDAIVGTSYYVYVRGITSGALPQKYYSILPYVSKALKNQQYLLKKSDECVLYLAGSNCIVTRNRVFPVAEDCFASYLGLESLSEEEIMLQLRRTNHVTPVSYTHLDVYKRQADNAGAGAFAAE